MTKRALAVLFACLAIAAVVAGCGGGDDTTSGGDTTAAETTGGASTEASGSAPTKAVFIKEADKICTEATLAMGEELNEYLEENGLSEEKEPTDAQEVEVFESVVLPNVAQQGEEIAALTPPEGEEETVEEITDALAEGVEDGEADPEQVTSGDNPLEAASKKALAYGMKSCGAE